MSVDKRLVEIGQRFESARAAVSMTLREAGGAANVSNAFICQVEKGQTRISLDRAARLAAVYGVSLDWLATGRSVSTRSGGHL